MSHHDPVDCLDDYVAGELDGLASWYDETEDPSDPIFQYEAAMSYVGDAETRPPTHVLYEAPPPLRIRERERERQRVGYARGPVMASSRRLSPGAASGVIIYGKPTAQSVSGFVEEGMTWQDSGEALDQDARQLNTDATAWIQSAGADPARLDLWNRWIGWYVAWQAWFAETGGIVRSTLGLMGEKYQEFKAKRDEFTRYLAELKAAGVRTSVAPPETRSRAEQALAGAWDNKGTILLIAALVLLPLYLPALTGAYLALRRLA